MLHSKRSTFIGDVNEQGEESVIENFDEQFVPVDTQPSATTVTSAGLCDMVKTARCKTCGLLISREVEEIEMHMATCGSGFDSAGSPKAGDCVS